MSKKTSPTVIGGFVVGAILLLAASVALFGGSQLFAKRVAYVAYFEEQTKGLRVGSNVVLNGVRIGYVSEIALLIDDRTFATITRVTLEILPDTYIPIRNNRLVDEDLQQVIPHGTLINEAGLRAMLEIESFVTGQLLVRLTMRPETPANLLGMQAEHPEIPTIRSDIQELLAKVQQWLSNFRDDVDIGELSEGLSDALRGFGRLMNSPDLHETIEGLNLLVNDADVQQLGQSIVVALNDVSTAANDASRLFKSADEGIVSFSDDVGPVLRELTATLETAEGTLEAARLQLRGDSAQVYQLQTTLREVEGAAHALREFFDYLERNPEALIKGKKQ